MPARHCSLLILDYRPRSPAPPPHHPLVAFSRGNSRAARPLPSSCPTEPPSPELRHIQLATLATLATSGLASPFPSPAPPGIRPACPSEGTSTSHPGSREAIRPLTAASNVPRAVRTSMHQAAAPPAPLRPAFRRRSHHRQP
jgi:hypothetical protein